jgi:hypothetical protein
MPRPSSERATRKIFLRVPFSDKDEAKRLGAGFEYFKAGQKPEGAPPGHCFIPPGELVAPFAKWHRIGNPFAPNPTEIPTTTGGKNAAAVALGSLGGRAGGHKGGRARAANLTPEELSAIGRKGAAAKRAKAEEPRRQNLADARGMDRIPDQNSSPDDGLIVLGRLVTGDDW